MRVGSPMVDFSSRDIDLRRPADCKSWLIVFPTAIGRKPILGDSLMRQTARRIADNAQGNIIVRLAVIKIIAFISALYW